jgi:hypothetical protein
VRPSIRGNLLETGDLNLKVELETSPT